MISTARQAPVTCTTGVSSSSSSSSSFIASSSSPSSSLLQKLPSSASSFSPRPLPSFLSSCFTSSAHSSPEPPKSRSWSISSPFLSLLLFSLCLFLPLRSLVFSALKGSGLSLTKPFYFCILLMLVVSVTPADSFPADKISHNSNDNNTGVMPFDSYSNNPRLVADRTVSISIEKRPTSEPSLQKPNRPSQLPRGKLENSYQGDQPPRRTAGGDRDFHPNYVETQGRLHYLTAANFQYLQIYNNTVMGTTTSQPPLGLMAVFQHMGFTVLKHVYTQKFLCMDSTFELYLGTNPDDRDCIMKTVPMVNSPQQIYKNMYIFVKHQRYLGIDCERTVSWVDAPGMDKSPVRFYEYQMDKNKEKKKWDEQVKTLDEAGLLGKSCDSLQKRRRQIEELQTEKLQKLQKKQRQQWCWSLPKMLSHIKRKGKTKSDYVHECKMKHSESCMPTSPIKGSTTTTAGPASKCVCDILRNMLEHPRMTKHECLVDKIRLRLKKKSKLEPNIAAVNEAARRMVRHYDGIARRMRTLKCQKKKKKEANKRKCRKKLPGIKINGLLETYEEDLTSSKTELLSTEFKRAIRNLDGLNAVQRKRLKRRRNRNRNRKRKRSRKTNPSPSKSTTASTFRSALREGRSSPG